MKTLLANNDLAQTGDTQTWLFEVAWILSKHGDVDIFAPVDEMCGDYIRMMYMNGFRQAEYADEWSRYLEDGIYAEPIPYN